MSSEDLPTKYKPVFITWRDARYIEEILECDLEDAEDLAPYMLAGFLVSETKDAVVVTMGFLPPANPRDVNLFRHIICIPRNRIESMQYLKLDGKKVSLNE